MRAMRLVLLVVVVGCGRSAPLNGEMRARDEFVRRVAEREGLADVWSLISRSTISFEDGLTPIQMIDPAIPFAGWREVPQVRASGLAQPVRWMGPRAHLRLRGDDDMRLEIRGRVDLEQLFTRPTITATFDGAEFHSAMPDADGYFLITAQVDAARIREWADVYVTISTVHEWWRDLTTLRVARFEQVVWEPVAPRSR